MTRVLCFGDSNTFGYDPRSPLGDRYPREVRWTGRLLSNRRDVLNCGQNGLSIPCEASEMVGLLKNMLPLNAVIVLLGTNDLLSGASAEEAAERMEALLSAIRKAFPALRLLLIAPPPLQPGDWVREQAVIDESARLGGLYRALAEKLGVEFADASEWNVALAFDGVHFSPEGHAAFARGIEALLGKR